MGWGGSPVRAARWLTLMSSSPSEMCFRAASVTALLLLVELLVLESSEELDTDAGLGSGTGGGGDGEGAGGRVGRRGG